MKLTRFEIEELSHKVSVRLDTVCDDSESASDWEKLPGKLATLSNKLNLVEPSRDIVFDSGEIDELVEEVENLIDISQHNIGELKLRDSNSEIIVRIGLIKNDVRKYKKLIDKLTFLENLKHDKKE